ncbi:Pre-mRNA-splicing factor CWC24 [Intoshia linei]|uniref:Pre-mRNA-splicing factor CWC24 n=1 Tax=Intoshia linei TaxID=1819745 RepID=A0A177B647_9BILA|nr:Pre-mRNA-splicing factor CWC24 [Intoshia linei]
MTENNSVCTFKFKKKRNQTSRKTQKANKSSDSDSEDEINIFKKPKSSFINPLIKSSGNFEKVKQKLQGISCDSFKKVSHSFKSDESKENSKDIWVTATNDIETEVDKDSQALFQKYIDSRETLGLDESETGIYKGMNHYNKFINPKDSVQATAASGKSRVGPIRSSANVNSSVRWDYAPCICKDYKETGFCGFGDSCIFMHDRTDYKFGWQLEQETDQLNVDEEDYEIKDDDKDELPFACYICRESFKKPVVTKCKHYFCEECALNHYRENKRCFVCDKQTNGVFNPAKQLSEKLKKYRINNENEDEDEDCFE